MEQQLEALKGELRRLQLEHDLLKKANEILKKDLGVNLQLLTNREKTMLVDALRPGMPSRSCWRRCAWRAAPISTTVDLTP